MIGGYLPVSISPFMLVLIVGLTESRAQLTPARNPEVPSGQTVGNEGQRRGEDLYHSLVCLFSLSPCSQPEAAQPGSVKQDNAH